MISKIILQGNAGWVVLVFCCSSLISQAMTLVNDSFCGKLSSLLQEKNIEQIHLLWHLQQVFKVAAQRQKNVGSKIAIIFLFF